MLHNLLITNLVTPTNYGYEIFFIAIYFPYTDKKNTTGRCKMMFPINNLVYSVTVLYVYCVNYLVRLLITTRTNQVGEHNAC